MNSLDAVARFRLELRSVALAARLDHFPARDGDRGGEHQDHHGSRGHARAVAPDELPCAVAPAIGTSDDRFAALVTRDVFRECSDRLITLGGTSLQRSAENRVEITLTRPLQPIARYAAFRQDLRRL
jgi:hypothetical protein